MLGLQLMKGCRKFTFKHLFNERGPNYIETSPLICRINRWAGFYMLGTFSMKLLTIKSILKTGFLLLWQRKKMKFIEKCITLSRNTVHNCLLKFQMLKWLKTERTFRMSKPAGYRVLHKISADVSTNLKVPHKRHFFDSLFFFRNFTIKKYANGVKLAIDLY